MSRPGRFWTIPVCLITGAALYVTRGVLDQGLTAEGTVRLALLPPWQALAGFMITTAVVMFGVSRRYQIQDTALPLVSAGLLIFPYLPIVPDRWPVLQILAGPLRYIVWLVIAAQVLWAGWQIRPSATRWLERWPRRRVSAAIGVCTFMISAAAAARLTGTAAFPGGDEPHYLVMAQSLWRDGDLKIANNHTRGDYHEYYEASLEPHYLTLGKDGEIYSVHPVGLAVLLAPIYAAGGYAGAVIALMLMAALATGLAWGWTASQLNSGSAATFAWAAIAGSTPFLFNTFTVYPEIAAALAVMVVLTLAVKGDAAASGLGRWIVIGVACGTLPWLSTKYAPMSAMLMLVALARTPRDMRAAALATPYAVSLAGWFTFFYIYWGTPWPQAPYGAATQMASATFLLGGPGLLFDQEYGLLAYAPVYILAFTGLLAMWRSGGELQRQSVEIVMIFSALLATVGTFGIWWGGTAAPARPIASGLLLLALPIATAFRSAPAGSPRRAGQYLLLVIGIGISVTMAIAQKGLLVNNDRDGMSALIEWWLPAWDTWTLAPSFTRREVLVAFMHTGAWLGVAATASVVLSRCRTVRPGASALIASGVFAVSLVAASMVMSALPGYAQAQPRNIHGRARIPALDEYDARALPVAVIYDPARVTTAGAILPLLTLAVEPGLRSDPQPVRVIHNGRFSLPAGRFDVTVTFGDQATSREDTLAMQVGRSGPPLETWTIQAEPGRAWRATIDLPVDISFLGFRGSADMERAIASIVITPTALVDAGSRPRTSTVFSAARYADVSMYMHDPALVPEAGGFWTRGNSTSIVSVASSQGGSVTLVVHCGAKANRVSFSAQGVQEMRDLVPGVATSVTLPPRIGPTVLTIVTDGGFSPRDSDPASRDTRFLGAWIEVSKP